MALVDDRDVAQYEKRRYGTPGQKFIDHRERRMMKEMIQSLDQPPGDVLDAPCGYGRFSTWLAGWDVHMICADVSAAMVARARERLEEGGRKERYVVMDIRHLPFKDAVVDATFTLRLFHHGFAKDQMASILKELARVSRRWVILSYYRTNRIHALFRRLKGFSSRIKMMTDAEFELERAGLGLMVRSRRPLVRLFHAQTLVILEKRPSGGSKDASS